VTGNAQQTLGCTTRLDLGAEPATARHNATDPLEPRPLPDDSHLAQYSETAIAGGLWHITGLLGGGDPRAGLGPLLRALHRNPPASMRDARDALAEEGSIETTREEHEQITEILRRQRINWYFDVQTHEVSDTGGGQTETQVRMEGPGAYDCAVQDQFADNAGLLPEERGADIFELAGTGGLPYTWHDDCFGEQDGDTPPGGYDWFFVEFPYSGSSDPTGDDLTLSVRYTCATSGTPDQCASSITAGLRIRRGFDGTTTGTSGNARQHVVDVVLPRNTWTPVLQVDGLGRCQSLVDGADCSI
jgi:hypothetical protein